MKDQSVDQWLAELASAAPAPGGGAAAALGAASGAALVEMVCNLSVGRATDDGSLPATLARATEVRHRAVALAAEDAEVFGTVMDAYKLPRGDEAAVAERRAAIQAALAGAARVPLEVAAAAAEVVTLCTAILPLANPNVLSDVAVAAAAAGAALDSSVVNVEVNLAALKDEGRRAELTAALAPYVSGVAQAEGARVVAEVRRRISA